MRVTVIMKLLSKTLINLVQNSHNMGIIQSPTNEISDLHVDLQKSEEVVTNEQTPEPNLSEVTQPTSYKHMKPICRSPIEVPKNVQVEAT